MVRAWFMDPSCTQDQRCPHLTDPPQFLSVDDLKKTAGIDYIQIDVDSADGQAQLERVKKERGYTYEDSITITPEKLPNYNEKLKMFFKEHIHADEEIRLFKDGSGYFDIRDNQDRWVRIECVKGDLLILPAGIYHRFTLDTKDYADVGRFFVGEPVWTPINRPADDHPARQEYVKTMAEA